MNTVPNANLMMSPYIFIRQNKNKKREREREVESVAGKLNEEI
jgi:hypothetical protein